MSKLPHLLLLSSNEQGPNSRQRGQDDDQTRQQEGGHIDQGHNHSQTNVAELPGEHCLQLVPLTHGVDPPVLVGPPRHEGDHGQQDRCQPHHCQPNCK